MKLELTEEEFKSLAEAIDFLIYEFDRYDPERDTYNNYDNQPLDGQFMRDIMAIDKKYLNPEDYEPDN